MDEILTHLALDRRLCGEPLEIGAGRALLRWKPGPETRADERGLVHGGFVFGFADHAAMLAVNHPNVVLGEGGMRFLRPVVVGETLTAEARVGPRQGAKIPVTVEVRRGHGASEESVATGDFVCFTPGRHVLDR